MAWQSAAESGLPQTVLLSLACCRRGISVMEDEGTLSDHTSGISANDGTWHHIAVTWQSSDGKAILYDNGRKVRFLKFILRALLYYNLNGFLDPAYPGSHIHLLARA